MMHRIEQAFKQNKVYIGYLMAGDGGMDRTLEAALALIKGGVTLLEIGVPFSDPIADGPVIQRAAQRALAAGTTLNDVLILVKRLRQHTDIPLILFSYLNPIYVALRHNIFAHAQQAGIDGILMVDCPVEEASIYYDACVAQQLAPIYVVTPATPIDRVMMMDKKGKGFLYYACRKGTTGIRDDLPEGFAEKIQEIKSVVHLPVAVGFGISKPAMVKQILNDADAFVVGSLFVKAVEENKTADELTALARSLMIC